MRLIFRTGIVPFMLCMQGIELHAQSILSKIELGANAGVFIYQGDLTPSRFGSFKTPGLQLGISAGMPLNHFLAARANIAFGKIRGDDAKYDNPEWRQHRNLNFSSPVFEVSGQVVWNIMGDPQNRMGITPYLFGGAGLSFLRVRRSAANFDGEYFMNQPALQTGLTADLEQSTPKALLVFPVGAGLRYPLTNKISLNTEAAYRLAFNDYIDGFSKAGNPGRKDHYHSVSVGVLYRIGSPGAVGCPVVRP
jgi:opacity protein-like surface antigen